jgi:hypothetical protein
MLFVGALPVEHLDCFRAGYLFAYTHKYPIPPKKSEVIAMAPKLETYLTKQRGNIERKSQGKITARYSSRSSSRSSSRQFSFSSSLPVSLLLIVIPGLEYFPDL